MMEWRMGSPGQQGTEGRRLWVSEAGGTEDEGELKSQGRGEGWVLEVGDRRPGGRPRNPEEPKG